MSYTSTENWIDKINVFCPPQVTHSSGTFEIHSFPSILLLNEKYQEKYKTHKNEYYLAAVSRERAKIEKENENREKVSELKEIFNVDVESGQNLPEINITCQDMLIPENDCVRGKSVR